MTKFRLKEIASNRLLTKFHILNQNDETVGSVNVPTRQAGDLAKHWAGPTDMPKQSTDQQQGPFASALRPQKMSPAARNKAILRGC